jgi:hypothetical protein
MSLKSSVGGMLAPHAAHAAPGITTRVIREALHRALHGVGPLPPAAEAADKQLAEQKGNVERAIHEVIENHVRYAGANGFVTNLGGLVTAAVTIPANVAGLALIQCRMVAGIAHLRGYDLNDSRVRNAILACILGEERVAELIRERTLPAPPMALATAPVYDPGLDRVISTEVGSDVIGKIAGRRVAMTVARRLPLLGGIVGMGVDGFITWRIGRYADRELLPRPQQGG